MKLISKLNNILLK